jgi:hypothetical protein
MKLGARLPLASSLPGTVESVILIAETGGDMTRFASPADLSSWAGMCPGNNESAGKRGNTRTRKGDTALRAALGEAALAAARTRGTSLGERHRHLARRRGSKKAAVATGRHILEIAYWIMVRGVPYQDLGPDYRHTRVRDPKRRADHLTREFLALGYTADVATHRAASPWYTRKAEPSFQDTTDTLRRVIIAARSTPTSPRQATDEEILAVTTAWARAA